MTLRCQTQQELPKEGLSFVVNDGNHFFAEKDLENWSFPLEVDNKYFDSATFDWLFDHQLTSDDGQQFDFLGSEMKIFVDGAEFGLPYFVEVDGFPPVSYKDEFWIICKKLASDSIKAFAYEVTQIQVSVGLPIGWVLFSLK
jgi:hypothetical protein